MKYYFGLAGLAFFITFVQHSFLAELLGKYAPDIAIVVLYVFLFMRRGVKDHDIELACFFGFCLGLFSALFSGTSMGALSFYYVVWVLIYAFLVKRTSHILALFFIGAFLSRFLYLISLSYFASSQVALSSTVLNALITSFVFLFAATFARNYRIRVIHDKR
jgi:hypothetical protein